MSAKELILDGGDTLDGIARKLRLNDTPDGKCVTVRSPGGVLAVLDRRQQHILCLYLQERLNRRQRKAPVTNNDRNEVIEQCAAVVDQCNREGPYQAIAAAKRIRALKDFTPEPYCMQQTLNQTCGQNPRKCEVCGFEPDLNR